MEFGHHYPEAVAWYSDSMPTDETGETLTHQALIDIQQLPLADRYALTVSRPVAIYEHGQYLDSISLNLFLAVSHTFQEVYKHDPNVVSINITTSLCHGPVLHIIQWLKHNTTTPVFEPPLVMRSLYDNLSQMRAARQLGLENQYTYNVRSKYWSYFTRRVPAFEDITLLTNFALDDQDPLYNGMALNFCRLRFEQALPSPDLFAAYLATNAKLAATMSAIDAHQAIIREENRKKTAEREWWANRIKEVKEKEVKGKEERKKAREVKQLQKKKNAQERLADKAQGSGVLSEKEIAALMGRA
jgi:hypothetical protein